MGHCCCKIVLNVVFRQKQTSTSHCELQLRTACFYYCLALHCAFPNCTVLMEKETTLLHRKVYIEVIKSTYRSFEETWSKRGRNMQAEVVW